MYGNYSISKKQNYKDYERVIFCLKALGKDSKTDNFTRFLHVEQTRSGSRIVATDGRRLHVANLSVKIPSGNYKPEVKNCEITFGESKDVPFPAWKNVVPMDAEYKGVMELDGITSGSKEERDEKFTNAYCSFLFDTGCNVNLGWIKDLPSSKWKIFTKKGKTHLVMLQNLEDEQNQFAVFVPLSA